MQTPMGHAGRWGGPVGKRSDHRRVEQSVELFAEQQHASAPVHSDRRELSHSDQAPDRAHRDTGVRRGSRQAPWPAGATAQTTTRSFERALDTRWRRHLGVVRADLVTVSAAPVSRATLTAL
jgi:hypothetical protein